MGSLGYATDRLAGTTDQDAVLRVPEEARKILPSHAQQATSYFSGGDFLNIAAAGGYLSLEVAAANPFIRCAASLAGANIGVFGEGAKHDPKIASQLASYIDDAGAIVGVDGKAAVSRWIQHTAEDVPKLTGKSVLLVGADRDTIVPSKLHHEPLVRAFIEGHHNDLTVETFDTDRVFSSHRITLARTIIAWLNSRCKPGHARAIRRRQEIIFTTSCAAYWFDRLIPREQSCSSNRHGAHPESHARGARRRLRESETFVCRRLIPKRNS